MLYLLSGKAFVPPPDVDVGVVHFVPRIKPFIDVPFPLVQKLCRQLFHFRQKECKNCLK